MKKFEKLTTNSVYHILNRGVDKRKIFLDDQDHFRFIHDLFEFNDTKQVINNTYFFKNNSSTDIGCQYIYNEQRKPRKLLIEIWAFCLMPNHYHLLVKPLLKDSLPLFMKKLNMGYAKYFNNKYRRTGALFEGKYKSIIIEEHSHFLYLPYYIHLNPLDLTMPEWRDGKIKSHKKATEHLENYRWSSHLDYIGKKNFPSVTQRKYLLDFFKNPKKYKNEIFQYLKEMNEKDIKEIILE